MSEWSRWQWRPFVWATNHFHRWTKSAKFWMPHLEEGSSQTSVSLLLHVKASQCCSTFCIVSEQLGPAAHYIVMITSVSFCHILRFWIFISSNTNFFQLYLQVKLFVLSMWVEVCMTVSWQKCERISSTAAGHTLTVSLCRSITVLNAEYICTLHMWIYFIFLSFQPVWTPDVSQSNISLISVLSHVITPCLNDVHSVISWNVTRWYMNK